MNDELNSDYIIILENEDEEEYETYCGPSSVGWFIVLTLLCPFAAIFVPCCPCDKRKRQRLHVVV